MASKKKKKKKVFNDPENGTFTHRDSKYLGVSGEEVWVCAYAHMCTHVQRGVGGLHMAFIPGRMG